MYKIVFRGKAARQVQNLPAAYFQRVSKRIDALAHDPRPRGAKKLTGESGYRLRVGVYRILYEVDDAAQVVTIYRVKHRKEAYRK